ncbi:MAG: hypothetical protein ACKO9Z_17090 [Planctomycetota bacterium]|jgi:hypothetical protein|nr:hypothetical protein [Planctomycetota bacterium]
MARKRKTLTAYGFSVQAGEGTTIEILQQNQGQQLQKIVISKDQIGSLTEMLDSVKEEIENPPDEDEDD